MGERDEAKRLEGKLLLDQGYALLRLARSSPCDGFLPDGLNVLQQAEPANPLAGLRRLLWRLMELHPTYQIFLLMRKAKMWGQNKAKEQEARHQERLKCLEHGLPLPDAELAWAAVVYYRTCQLTAVLIVGSIVLIGGPVGVTAILLALGQQLPALGLILLLAIIWCACASRCSAWCGM